MTCPSVTDTISYNGMIINLLNTCLAHTVTNAIFKVNNQTTIIHLVLPSESIERHTSGSSRFTIDFETIQKNAIIARTCCLGFMAKWRSDAKSRQFNITNNRHQGYITQVTAACSTQMQLCKAHNRISTLMIARAPIPTHFRLSRSSIDHTLWNVSAKEDMAMVARSNGRIDILGIVLGRKACKSKHQR